MEELEDGVQVDGVEVKVALVDEVELEEVEVAEVLVEESKSLLCRKKRLRWMTSIWTVC